MSNVLVSVIIPVYNRERFINKSIRSILDQSLNKEQYEVIVVDDGSKDGTSQILNNYSDRIKILTNNKNYGLPYSLNRGIKKSKGRFIIRLDSDDYVNKEYLYILSLHLLLNDDIDAVSCDYLVVDEKDKVIKKNQFKEDPIGCCLMFRMEHLIEIGLYNEDYLIHEDKEILKRFNNKFKIYNCPLPLYRYMMHSTNLTKTKK